MWRSDPLYNYPLSSSPRWWSDALYNYPLNSSHRWRSDPLYNYPLRSSPRWWSDPQTHWTVHPDDGHILWITTKQFTQMMITPSYQPAYHQDRRNTFIWPYSQRNIVYFKKTFVCSLIKEIQLHYIVSSPCYHYPINCQQYVLYQYYRSAMKYAIQYKQNATNSGCENWAQ